MRARLCLSLLCLLLPAACKFDDGNKPTLVKATAVDGQDLVLKLGYARLEISSLAIGSGAGQLPVGSIVSLTATENFVEDGRIYSPVLRVRAANPDGSEVAGLSLGPPARVYLRYDHHAATRDGNELTELRVLKKSGSAVTVFEYSSSATVTDTEFISPEQGWVLCDVTSFSDFVVTEGGEGDQTPEPVVLTGEVSSLAGFTIFTLQNAAETIEANLAIPTSLTTVAPTVQALNDDSYDASNPSAAGNRILTVATGGKNYTTDAAGAGVTLSLNTFNSGNSSGALTGVLVEVGGPATLAVNYSFTTTASTVTALSGAITDLGGRRTMTLQDSGATLEVVLLMPDTLPAAPFPATVAMDASTFDAASPLNVAGRVITVRQAGVTYSSDVASPVAADVDVAFASFAAGVSAGTIQGTVVSAAGAPLSINYTFTTIAGAGAGGTGSLAFTAPVDVGTGAAVESAVVFDGTNYVVLWLSATGVTNRTIEIHKITPAGATTGTQSSIEPAAALQGAAGIAAAISPAGVLVVVATTGTTPTTSSVVVLVIDYDTPEIVDEYTLGSGVFPRIVFNTAGSGQFVVAYTGLTGVALHVLDADGANPSSASTVLLGAALGGLASAVGADEVLVSGPDGSGVRGRRITASTGATAGAAFDLSTTLAGGLSVFDNVSGRYLALVQQQAGFAAVPLVRQVVVGTGALDAQSMTLGGLSPPTQAVAGDNAVLLCDLAGNFHAVVGDATTGPAQIGLVVVGALTGLALDVSNDGPALASDGAGGFLAACARGGSGVSVIRFTVTAP